MEPHDTLKTIDATYFHGWPSKSINIKSRIKEEISDVSHTCTTTELLPHQSAKFKLWKFLPARGCCSSLFAMIKSTKGRCCWISPAMLCRLPHDPIWSKCHTSAPEYDFNHSSLPWPACSCWCYQVLCFKFYMAVILLASRTPLRYAPVTVWGKCLFVA